jgi:hypothetical protein
VRSRTLKCCHVLYSGSNVSLFLDACLIFNSASIDIIESTIGFVFAEFETHHTRPGLACTELEEARTCASFPSWWPIQVTFDVGERGLCPDLRRGRTGQGDKHRE